MIKQEGRRKTWILLDGSVSQERRRTSIQMYSKQIKNENSKYYYEKRQRELFLQKLMIMQVNDLQQRILSNAEKAKNPSQALCQAYEMLSEEQKIAFLLAGGIEELFCYQQQEREREQEQRNQTDQSSSDPRTDDLPILW